MVHINTMYMALYTSDHKYHDPCMPHIGLKKIPETSLHDTHTVTVACRHLKNGQFENWKTVTVCKGFQRLFYNTIHSNLFQPTNLKQSIIYSQKRGFCYY